MRFPITGIRVRNYDGLGGQVLVAFLHRHDMVRLSGNRLGIDGTRLEALVLDGEVAPSYTSLRTKLVEEPVHA